MLVYTFLMSREEKPEVSCPLSCALTLIMTEMQIFRYTCAVLLRREVRREVSCEVTLLEL